MNDLFKLYLLFLGQNSSRMEKRKVLGDNPFIRLPIAA